MKVAPCIQEVSGHTTSLLTSLNLQREKALFCDCVVRQTQNPGQLHPAHRCVLAASSPVLASILSSTGALVELQDPCLSGSVLAVLLDYIYTGALPCSCSQRQYNSLLSAACYLQMNKLQEALCARQQAEFNEPNETDTSTGTESQAYKNIISTHSEAADTFNGGLLSTCSIDACRGDEHTCSVQHISSSLEGTNRGKYDGTQVHSHSIDTCPNEATTNTCGARSGAKCCNRKDASTLSESSGNAGDCSEVIHLTPRAVIQNIPSSSEGYSVSTVDKDTQKDQFHSAGTIKPETWQATTEGELVRRTSSSSASSLQHTCYGAVPVICHSSTAAMLQLAEVATATFYNPASRTSGDFSRVSTPRPASTENNTVEDIAGEHKSHYGKGNLDHRDNKDHSGTQSWDSKDTLHQCDTRDSRYKSRTNQSDSLKQDYTCSSANHLIKLSDKRGDSGLSHVTDCNGYHANCMYDHNENQTKPFGEDSVPQSKVCSRFIGGLKYKTNLSFDDLPYKHQRLDWSDWDVSMSAAVKEPPQDLRTGSSSHCGDICSEGEVKGEHSCSSKYPFAMTKHFSQHDCDSDNRNTATEDERHSADVCPHVSNTPESKLDNVTSGLSVFEHQPLLDLGKISDANTSEPHFAFTVPVASDTSHSMYSAVGQSYHGHVHYHCLSKEETHLTHIDSHTDSSDHSSDDEAFGTFASPGQSPMRQHFDTGTPEQVLLLDISTKHAELLVSYKHRADQEKKALDKKDPLGTGIENNDREQRNEKKSVAGTKIRARTKFRATTFSGSRNKPVEERQFVDREQSRLGPEVKNKAEAVEVSRHGEVAYQTGTLTGCPAPTVPESAQAYVSSTLSVCIPSSLPASTSTNISSHLSTPVHHAFQCSLCDRSFSQRGSLNRHVRSHLGVRPFPCPCCPMTFSRQYRVTEHMRVHQRCALGNYLAKPPASSI
ncbi:Hypermethylated in cancer 2 protein [Channa argus]|uniref:Hypermethylated in cancer 2 protein n=1 Tax=Channa argus TaxID=215402 RepID=A0A6G1P7U7_CHAAH|nr:Hypermethylated in cancer 2 protein [Channa argus]